MLGTLDGKLPIRSVIIGVVDEVTVASAEGGRQD